MTLSGLVRRLPDALIQRNSHTTISDIVYDSRAIVPGALFVALRGADADGHDYAGEAVHRGARALLIERPLDLDLPQIVVADSRAALARIAATFFGDPSTALGVIGVTGTDGKTTTSHLVDAILRATGRTTGLVGTVEVRIGDLVTAHSSRQTTPESVDLQRSLRAMVDAGVSWATLEATSHGLAMHRLDEVAFQVAAVTNITHEHLDFHKTIESYRQAKGILFARVAASGGTAVINVDDPGARAMLPVARGAKQMTYSADGGSADLRALRIRPIRHGSQFDLEINGWGVIPVDLPMIGNFNVANALCAIGCAWAAGIEPPAAAAALREAPAVPGRMARIDAGQPFAVVIDYAHTPDALQKVLPLLRAHHPDGRLIAVFGSAGERDRAKRPRQGEVAAKLADYAVFTTEDPRHEDPDAIIAEIATGAAAAGWRSGADFVTLTDRREAIRHALGRAQPNDCVLLAGKGHEDSIIWGREKRPWDEATVAREELARLGYHPSPEISPAR